MDQPVILFIYYFEDSIGVTTDADTSTSINMIEEFQFLSSYLHIAQPMVF